MKAESVGGLKKKRGSKLFECLNQNKNQIDRVTEARE